VAQRDEIIRYANELLEIDRFPEYGTPGLQVVGVDEVTKIACGVSSSQELFEHVLAGRIKVGPRQSYALKDAAQAHRDLEGRKTTGSTILVP